jgi:hypothetical protein
MVLHNHQRLSAKKYQQRDPICQRDLRRGYSKLNTGDAVVIPGDHMFLIGLNYEVPPSGGQFTESYVCCYEQTPPYAVGSFWTYAKLQEGGYVPFSKFK